MTARFSFGSRFPSASAWFQPPAYQVHDTPFADKVSPIVFAVCGGTGLRAGSASSRFPPAAGGRPLGWYGGCEVFTVYPSGVTVPARDGGGPSAGGRGNTGGHEQRSQ